MVIVLNKKNFEREVVEGDIPVIVDFWAPWCGPCQVMGPIFENLSEGKNFEGKLKFCKINVDDENEIASRYGIQGIPCLVIMRGGKEVDRIVGLMPKDLLKKRINEILNEI